MDTLTAVTVEPKPTVTSKINWLALITIAGGVAAYFTQQMSGGAAIGVAAIGTLNFIFRTYFTTSPVSGLFTVPPASTLPKT